MFAHGCGTLVVLVYCLTSVFGRAQNGCEVRRFGAPWLGLFLLLASGCTVNEPPNSKLACLAGEPCQDAAADTSEVRLGPADAQVEPTPSAAEAGAVMMCPTACNPEDVQTCASANLQALRVGDAGQSDGLIAVDVALGAVDAGPVYARADGGATQAELGPPGADAGFATDQAGLTSESLMSLPSDAALDGGIAGDGDAPRGDAGRGLLDVLDAAPVTGPGAATPVLACQLVFHDGSLAAECAQSGAGSEGSACSSARDCAPGLGCVGSTGAGQCLPYCCGGNDSCGEGRYCTQRALRSPDITDEATAPTIPVCAVADNCSLMLGPCTSQDGCSCPAGLACTVVRASTTACVEPGAGEEGESCPCAPGYFCSQGTNTCLKFCNTQDPVSNCGARECQPGPSGFPMGWGLCVGE